MIKNYNLFNSDRITTVILKQTKLNKYIWQLYENVFIHLKLKPSLNLCYQYFINSCINGSLGIVELIYNYIQEMKLDVNLWLLAGFGLEVSRYTNVTRWLTFVRNKKHITSYEHLYKQLYTMKKILDINPNNMLDEYKNFLPLDSNLKIIPSSVDDNFKLTELNPKWRNDINGFISDYMDDKDLKFYFFHIKNMVNDNMY